VPQPSAVQPEPGESKDSQVAALPGVHDEHPASCAWVVQKFPTNEGDVEQPDRVIDKTTEATLRQRSIADLSIWVINFEQKVVLRKISREISH